MKIKLNSKLENLLQEQITAGKYTNPDEVIEEALHLLENRNIKTINKYMIMPKNNDRMLYKKSSREELTIKGKDGKILSKDSVSLPWWEKISGTYENNDAFNEAMELGRQYRQSLSKNLTEQE